MAGMRGRHVAQVRSGMAAPARRWHWYCRLDRGKDAIDPWYKRLSVRAQARFDRARDQLAELPLKMWSKPMPASYVQQDHIYVIRFSDEARQQWRVFGHAVPERWQFVMSVIATERDNEYKPKNAGEKASKFRAQIGTDFGNNARECFIDSQ